MRDAHETFEWGLLMSLALIKLRPLHVQVLSESKLRA